MDRIFKELVITLLASILYRVDGHSFEEMEDICKKFKDKLNKPCEVCDGQLPSQVFVYCARCGRKL